MSKLLKIGDVSKLCNISIKTLRYYEELKLIKPVKVDIYSGYRYYDEENINEIYKIQFFKNLNLSLDDIKNFNENTLKDKLKDIEKNIKQLKEQKMLITSLINQKGEKKMKPFINDEQAIGKWKYICSALSEENYKAGDFVVDNDILFKELYFLPEGNGYWVFDRWTKGEIYHYQGVVFTYKIEENKLYLHVFNTETNEFEIINIFEKVDSKKYNVDDIIIKDDINLKFVKDDDAEGFWEVFDFISSPETFSPSAKEWEDTLYLQKLAFDPVGNVNMSYKSGKQFTIKYTKGFVLDESSYTASKYQIKNINNDKYLIMEWKSGDYSFGGKVFGYYVFKKL